MNRRRISKTNSRELTRSVQILLSGVLTLLAALALVVGLTPRQTNASSHREAPFISTDPEADNTDLYAFVSPDMSNTVTIIANYVPLQLPAGGPNFNKFGDNVLYEIKIYNDGDGDEDVNYQFRFRTTTANPNTFLYNTGPITSLTDPDWNIRQTYSVTRIEGNNHVQVANNLVVPPANIGPRSTPNYSTLAMAATYSVGGRKFFAGPRDDPFYVDLGSIFDLAGLRPFNTLHAIPLPAAAGVDGVAGLNVHTIAFQVPITDLTRDHQPITGPNDPDAVIGIYASARRSSTRILYDDGTQQLRGKEVQVSRLGMPLVNEVIIPVGRKDYWNGQDAADEGQFLQRYLNPELTVLENALYSALDDAATTNRQDLKAIFLTGIPGLNFTGNHLADLLRLNMGVPPSASPDRLGAIAGQLDGFPNGRRLVDDIVDIEIRATAEGYGPILNSLLGLPNRSPNNLLGDGVDANDKTFLTSFPYVAGPFQGYEQQPPVFRQLEGKESRVMSSLDQ